jgi:hypothetical protein
MMNLPRESQKADEQDDFSLNDALLPGDDVLESVIELQRDQHSHDLTEDSLILERIQGTEHPARQAFPA